MIKDSGVLSMPMVNQINYNVDVGSYAPSTYFCKC